jgi:3' terminal RNA ribose 2'-O-methyltransferase Hen1
MLDAQFPEWGMSNYVSLELQQTITLQNLLSHLYVLIPVLDAEKHYWIGDEEVEKLLRHGQGWLKNHPEQELIAKRYLKRKRKLVCQALEQLVIEENPEKTEQIQIQKEELLEQPLSLNQQRLNMVVNTLKKVGAKRVIDLGCGEGKLIKRLLEDASFTEIVGVDVSYRSLEIAQEKLHLDRLPLKQQQRIKLFQGSLTYRDRGISGYDAATVVEVIEHLDLPRIKAFERVLFEFAHPRTIIITTPNIEYNIKFETLDIGGLRHKDHRFEWTRKQFQYWGLEVAEKFNYSVEFYPIGEEDSQVGSPTQMAVFRASC